MMKKTINVALLVAITGYGELIAQGDKSSSTKENLEFPAIESIEKLSNVEVWAGQIKKVNKNGINKRNVLSPIYISPAKLISPTSELSLFSKACIKQLKPVAGKKNYFFSTYMYFDEPEDFPNGQLPKIGEIWIFTCRRGIDGGLHFLSGAKLQESSKPAQEESEPEDDSQE